MNLMPTIISISLGISISFLYLHKQKDEPNKINYRAALSEFEQSALEFAAYQPLDANNKKPQSYCSNMQSDFKDLLPQNTDWEVKIAGLDCDTAILSITAVNNDEFDDILSAATESGRAQDTEIDYSNRKISWTQRLYSRKASDLGFKAKLKNNLTLECTTPCNVSTEDVDGDWSEWNPKKCPPCGNNIKQVRTCDAPAPRNNGTQCKRDDGTFTTASNNKETNKTCNPPICPSWSNWSNWSKCSADCNQTGYQTSSRTCKNVNQSPGLKCTGDKTQTQSCTGNCGTWQEIGKCPKATCSKNGQKIAKHKCTGGLSCQGENKIFLPGEIEYCNIPSCGRWSNWTTVKKNCVKDGDQQPVVTRQCLGANGCLDDYNKFFPLNGVEHRTKVLPNCPTWSKWSEWSECNGDCKETGSQTRSRTCNNENLSLGLTCIGIKTQTQSCKGKCGTWQALNTCPIQPTCLIDGQQDKPKRKCIGSFNCRRDDGSQFLPGYIEYCDTPRCGIWRDYGFNKCPTNRTCRNYFEKEDTKSLRCDGVMCEKDNKFYPYDAVLNISCGVPDCGRWDQWSSSNKVCSENKTKPEFKAQRKCLGENDCKNENDVLFSKNEFEYKEKLTVCGTWQEGQCKIKSKEYSSCKEYGTKKFTCSAEVCEPVVGQTSTKEYEEDCLTNFCQINLPTDQKKAVVYTSYDLNELIVIEDEEEPAKRNVKVVVGKGFYLIAPSKDDCAINTGEKFSSLVIENNGFIFGYYGSGGEGGNSAFDNNWINSTPEKTILDGKNGGDGGDAICIQGNNIMIKNTNDKAMIAGGKGGGGGGGGACYGYVWNFFTKEYKSRCAKGGRGGHGVSNWMGGSLGNDGQKGQELDDMKYVNAGDGGNAGFWIKDLIIKERISERGSNGYIDNDAPEFWLWSSSTVEVLGKGGNPGKDGKKCKDAENYTNIEGCNKD